MKEVLLVSSSLRARIMRRYKEYVVGCLLIYVMMWLYSHKSCILQRNLYVEYNSSVGMYLRLMIRSCPERIK